MSYHANEKFDQIDFLIFLISLVFYSVAISACGNGGQWEKALSLLDLVRKNVSH